MPCINVGKRAGRDQTPQREIERLMIEAAQQGLKVVRLKGRRSVRVRPRRRRSPGAATGRHSVRDCSRHHDSDRRARACRHSGHAPRRVVGFLVATGSDLESVDRVLASIAPPDHSRSS
jgi:hypothetical protein